MMKRLNAEQRDSDAGEPLNGNGGGALAGEAVARVATYVKELSAAAASALIEGDIPEAPLETNSNLNEVTEVEEEEDEEAGTESVKLASVFDVDSKDSAASIVSDEEFEDNSDE